jgi:hypothetical protein
MTFTRAEDVRICWRGQRNEEFHNLYSLNTFHQIVYIEDEGMNWACSVHGADEKSIKMLDRIPEIEMQLVRKKTQNKLENYIKMYLKEIGYQVKCKGEVCPKTVHEGPEGE